jgi:hypothetical protein
MRAVSAVNIKAPLGAGFEFPTFTAADWILFDA